MFVSFVIDHEERRFPVNQLMMAHGARRGLLLIALAALLWGTVGVCTRALYELSATNALSIGFFRLGLAAVALVAGSLATLRSAAWRLAPRDAGLAALIGAMLALYQACFFTAIGYAGVAISTLVTLCTAPVLAALLAVAVARERLKPAMVLALLLALAGTWLLIGLEPGAAMPAGILVGVLFALGSALGYATMAVCGRLMTSGARPLQINAVAFSTGALLLLVLALPTGFVAQYPAAGWGLLLYLGLVPTAFGYVLFLRGIASTSATAATVVTLLEPLVATLLAALLFGERLGALGALGALLLLGALGVLYRGAGNREAPTQDV
jgi:drug/metabolite transporter, DME family